MLVLAQHRCTQRQPKVNRRRSSAAKLCLISIINQIWSIDFVVRWAARCRIDWSRGLHMDEFDAHFKSATHCHLLLLRKHTPILCSRSIALESAHRSKHIHPISVCSTDISSQLLFARGPNHSRQTSSYTLSSIVPIHMCIPFIYCSGAFFLQHLLPHYLVCWGRIRLR